MQTVKKFSGNTAPTVKGPKFDWDPVSDGNIYKAVEGVDYSNVKGFLTSMTRWANETNHSVARFVAEDGSYVEFSLTVVPTENSDDTPTE